MDTSESRARRRGLALWAPRRRWWWIAVLFAAGSACFLVAPVPAFLQLVGPAADGAVFFAGSLLFTAAAALQWLETINANRGPAQTAGRHRRLLSFEPRRIDWWSAGVQLVGTLFFNATTLRALQTGLDSPSYDRLVWRPTRSVRPASWSRATWPTWRSPGMCRVARPGRWSRRSWA